MPSNSQTLPVTTRAAKPTSFSPCSIAPAQFGASAGSRHRRAGGGAARRRLRPARCRRACARSGGRSPRRRACVPRPGRAPGMDSTATPWVGLTWAITGRLAVCSGRSVTHTTSGQPRARSMRRPAEISELRSVGGSTSRSETNSTFHRAPGSWAASRSAMSGSRLSVNSEAGPGDASKPTTRSGCCEVAGSSPRRSLSCSPLMLFQRSQLPFGGWPVPRVPRIPFLRAARPPPPAPT